MQAFYSKNLRMIPFGTVAAGVSTMKSQLFERLFGRPAVAIGMIHLPPLPGSPRWTGASVQDVYELALADAMALREGGMHALIVENHGDVPFLRPQDIGFETVSFLTMISTRIAADVGLPIGINVLANAGIPSLAIAKASGAKFVRVNQFANAYVANEGFMQGDAGNIMRYRAMIDARDIAVFADSHVKHGSHSIMADRSITELTRDLDFFDADAVIATGQRSGDGATLGELREIEAAVDLPVLVGSGVTPDTIAAIMQHAKGVIIGSWLKQDSVMEHPVDRSRVVKFMRAFDDAVAHQAPKN